MNRKIEMAQGKTLDIWSKWVGDSQVQIRVRKIGVGHNKKFVVDLSEFSPEGIEVERVKLNQLAIDAARFFGTAGSDFCVIRDYLTYRKAHRADGVLVGLNVRQKSYVFGDFPEREYVPA